MLPSLSFTYVPSSFVNGSKAKGEIQREKDSGMYQDGTGTGV